MNRGIKNIKKQSKGREKRQMITLSIILLLGIFLLLPFCDETGPELEKL